MTKNSELEPFGLRGADAVRGRRSTRLASQRGVRFLDSTGNDVIAPEWTIIGGTVTGDDDDSGVITIGTGDTSGAYSITESDDLFLTRRAGGGHVIYTVAASGSSLSLSLTSATIFDITLTADCSLSFTSPSDSGVGAIFTIILRQDSTGGWAVTWPAAVQWEKGDGTSGASAPAIRDDPTAETVFFLSTLDGGTTYGAGPARPRWYKAIVTDGFDTLVWEGDDLVWEWSE